MRGRLTLWQPRAGYRFSVDPLLLVDFVQPPYGRVIDFCAGVGVVGFGLLTRDLRAHATLIEVQERLATLAQRNVDGNSFPTRATVFRADVADQSTLDAREKYDLAVCNPPYRRLDDGPASPDEEVAIANHEVKMTLTDLLHTMQWSLKPDGRAALVYPVARSAELLAGLVGEGLRPLRARFVHPRAHKPANLMLVEARKGARGPLVVEPPLILHDETGYTEEAAKILGDA